MASIAIVGTGLKHCKKQVRGFQGKVWCVSTAWRHLHLRQDGTRADRVFQLHRKKSFEKWLPDIARECELVLGRAHPDYPDALSLPGKMLFKEFVNGKVNPFTSSISWMMGMAILEQPETIAIYGVHMVLKSEYGSQRDGLFYLLGTGSAKGIKIEIPETSGLLRNMHVYGDIEEARG